MQPLLEQSGPVEVDSNQSKERAALPKGGGSGTGQADEEIESTTLEGGSEAEIETETEMETEIETDGEKREEAANLRKDQKDQPTKKRGSWWGGKAEDPRSGNDTAAKTATALSCLEAMVTKDQGRLDNMQQDLAGLKEIMDCRSKIDAEILGDLTELKSAITDVQRDSADFRRARTEDKTIAFKAAFDAAEKAFRAVGSPLSSGPPGDESSSPDPLGPSNEKLGLLDDSLRALADRLALLEGMRKDDNVSSDALTSSDSDGKVGLMDDKLRAVSARLALLEEVRVHSAPAKDAAAPAEPAVSKDNASSDSGNLSMEVHELKTRMSNIEGNIADVVSSEISEIDSRVEAMHQPAFTSVQVRRGLLFFTLLSFLSNFLTFPPALLKNQNSGRWITSSLL